MMADKTNIKELLFSKAVPNYIIPIPTHGHKLFSCTDCGDRFILESSYNYHINRKSVKITYKCRHCVEVKVFYNRCKWLSHIRSHVFKTATVNVTDLKVEPWLPTDGAKKWQDVSTSVARAKLQKQVTYSTFCYECKIRNTSSGVAYKDRAKHYMQYTNAILYSCPICMFTLPTTCALKAHLRIHLKHPPFYCPECGIQLQKKSVHYPYGHDCEGFKMMRATARLNCSVDDCYIFHPNEYMRHMKSLHLKKVYKCPVCSEVCFNEKDINCHLKSHNNKLKPIYFYKCQKCSWKVISGNQIIRHLKSHVKSFVYPCWTCGKIFTETSNLINHHMENHSQEIKITKQLYASILNDNTNIYTVKKTCDQCKQSFTLNVKQNKINSLLFECPNKCSSISKLNSQKNTINKDYIICHLCKNTVSQNWKELKRHYYMFHKNHKCVDVKILLKRIDKKVSIENEKNAYNKLKKTIIMKREDKYYTSHVIDTEQLQYKSKHMFLCNKCGLETKDRESSELHMREHRDPFMAYQCMECGESFAVKPSFSTHLLMEHGISDVMNYIVRKKCFNEKALVNNQRTDNSIDQSPLKENQCQICREQFDSPDTLQKHFRVHGMAFLMKNTNKTLISQ